MYKGMQGLTFSYAITELSNQWEMSGSSLLQLRREACKASQRGH